MSTGFDARVIAGDPADIAHVLIGLTIGLGAQEAAGWLGTSQASADRRWSLGAEILLNGLSHADPPQLSGKAGPSLGTGRTRA